MLSRRKVKQLQLCIVGFIMVMLYNLIEKPVKQNNVYNRHNLIMKRPEATLLSIHKNNYIDCHKIIEGNEEEILKANVFMKVVPPFRFTDEEYINKTKDCVQFRRSMKYDTYHVTDEEKEFPIAFSILTYKDSDQTERLLRAIYRPQNVYCIHVDGNSPPVLHIALNGIANCFENVFNVSKTEKVFYNHMTRLKADLNCMTDLLAVSQKWKYFINLPHQTFPLKTNLEIVKILKIYNGSNDIEGIITPERMMPYRIKFRHRYNHKNHSWVSIGTQNSSLPHNAAMVKGSAYGIFSRSFVRFVIHDKKTKDILDYLEDVKSPDEYYWAILNHNKVLQAPGQFTGEILILE